MHLSSRQHLHRWWSGPENRLELCTSKLTSLWRAHELSLTEERLVGEEVVEEEMFAVRSPYGIGILAEVTNGSGRPVRAAAIISGSIILDSRARSKCQLRILSCL